MSVLLVAQVASAHSLGAAVLIGADLPKDEDHEEELATCRRPYDDFEEAFMSLSKCALFARVMQRPEGCT